MTGEDTDALRLSRAQARLKSAEEIIRRQRDAVYSSVGMIDEAKPGDDLEPILRELVDGFFSVSAIIANGSPKTFVQESAELREALLVIRRHWWNRKHATPYERERWAEDMDGLIARTVDLVPETLGDEVAKR